MNLVKALKRRSKKCVLIEPLQEGDDPVAVLGALSKHSVELGAEQVDPVGGNGGVEMLHLPGELVH